jgi:hypothetical protein
MKCGNCPECPTPRITFLPMTMTGGIWPISVNGDTSIRTASDVASMRFVTPGFFAITGIPLLMGRDVAESDTIDRPFAAVVSESFARRCWPDQHPLGRHFQMAFHDREVIGVVRDIRVRGLERTSEPQVYLPYRQQPDSSFIFYAPKELAVKAAGNPMALASAIRCIVQRADPRQPLSDVRLLADIVAAETALRAAQVRVLRRIRGNDVPARGRRNPRAAGVRGIAADAGDRRSSCLGARPASILGMLLLQGLWTAAIGVAGGAVMGAFAGQHFGGCLRECARPTR